MAHAPNPHRHPGPNELRDHLANERTFLAWVRTAIAIVALGFVVAKFGLLIRQIGGLHVHPWTVRMGAIVGVILVVAGIISVLLATVRFSRMRNDIEHDRVNFDPTLDLILAGVIALASATLAAYIIITA